ncbi:MAG TPA: TIM-barrel domain-containing protein [Fimbriimonadaceae bacterium]
MRYPLSLIPVAFLATGALAQDNILRVKIGDVSLNVTALSNTMVQIECYQGKTKTYKPTEMLDIRNHKLNDMFVMAGGGSLQTENLVAKKSADGVEITGGGIDLDFAYSNGQITLRHRSTDNLYGMRGIALWDLKDPRVAPSAGLLRNNGGTVIAGSQGDGGAPLAYTATWGMLVDSIDGEFTNNGETLTFRNKGNGAAEAFVMIGPPKTTVASVTELTGHPPMPPKWALGFMNSQWGTTEDEVKSIIGEYRQKQIPIDGFIMDFDFKAWGEDNYGEFRWNSTSGPGNVEPNLYPDGQSGQFSKEMASKGIHLVGIMKPRILTQDVSLKPTKGAAEATAHNWWMPSKAPYKDYFSGRLANDLDFSKPDLRRWYWDHAKQLFDTGLSGWWNDEADDGFDSLGFFHMQQSLFDGQSSVSKKRVWSINRNFYLGAQRFGFGTWSGDIRTGFGSMQAQRARMLATVDLDQPHWSMDSGGFGGHPNSENYARWIEFASVVPIMRVHGTHGEKRQPWVYGDVAEAAAKKAIEWRYKMFPTFYSLEHRASATGVGIVRPLFWEFPLDPQCANVTDSWMVGDSLLVSPVVDQGMTTKSIYLPAGTWYDYATGKPVAGGQIVTVPVDSTNWSDLPMFIHGGAILASQELEQYAGEKPVHQITLDMWPDTQREGSFEVYDDDGETVDYLHNAYFSQMIGTHKTGGVLEVTFAEPAGEYRTPIKEYRLRLHGFSGSGSLNGRTISVAAGTDYIETVVPAGKEMDLTLQNQ